MTMPRVSTSPSAGWLRKRGRWLGRVSSCVAVSVVGLVPVVALAPAARAATSALTASSPPNFGTVPVGQFDGQDVQVTNTGASTLHLDLNNSGNSGGSLDFLPGPAISPSPTSCLDQNNEPVAIPAHAKCTLGIFFFPTHFGVRSTTMTFADSAGGTFKLSVAGTGVAGYFFAGANAFWTTVGFASQDLENTGFALRQPVVGIAGTSLGDGFWLAASDGGIFTAGSARFFGSAGNTRLNQPVVGIAASPTDEGYWLVASDGGIFTFGDAGFHGSTGNMKLNKPIVGMAATPDGKGYWLVASDGGIFTFGDAGFFGSTGNVHLNKPIVGMAASPTGKGYWLVASDGGIFTFGHARFFGSTGNIALSKPIVGMAASPTGKGYWLLASDGGIFTFGDVPFEGSLGGHGFNDIIGMAPTTAPLSDFFLVAPASVSMRSPRTSAGRKHAERHSQRPDPALPARGDPPELTWPLRRYRDPGRTPPPSR